MLGSIAALKYHVPRCLTSSFKNKLPAIKCHICKKSLGKKPGALVAHIKSTHPEVSHHSITSRLSFESGLVAMR